MTCKVDHFAIGASSLAAGVAALEPVLGVAVPYGSKHTLMSTHNCVMQAGNERFFELTAIDPDAHLYKKLAASAINVSHFCFWYRRVC